MDHTYWHRQTSDKPLFPDLLWSRPENQQTAGKLLIIGGNLHGFSTVAEAYNESEQAGIGSSRVLLPDALQKTVSKIFEASEFAPSTPSGSFARNALASFLDLASWAEGVLLAGNLGHNSETAIVLENFLIKHSGNITITGDSIDYFLPASSQLLLERPKTTLVPSFAQLQQLIKATNSPAAITSTMDMLRLVDALHEFSKKHSVNMLTQHADTAIVAVGGEVSTTKTSQTLLQIATHASVWWLQNPSKTFEALSTAVV